MREFREIVELVTTMMRDQSPLIRNMKEVLDRYDGDWVVPVPSVAEEPTLPPMTPMLVGEAIDSMAMRAASVRPMVTSPAIDPTKRTGRRSVEYATLRRRIVAATYHASRWQLARRRAYRHLSAYHTFSVVVVPSHRLKRPLIEVRDPLGTYAEPMAYEQLRVPEYVAFVTRHSAEHLRNMYPEVRTENGGPIEPNSQWAMWDTFEWYDCDQMLVGLLGPCYNEYASGWVGPEQ
jgi:hypothetical protein